MLRLDGNGAGTVGKVIYDDGLGNRGSENMFIGQLRMTLEMDGRSLALKTFSIDLFHQQRAGQQYQVNVRDMGPPPTFSDWMYGGEMAFLYGKYGVASLNNSVNAAALQLALWKLSLGPAGTLSTEGMNQNILSLQQALLAEAALYPKSLGAGRWLDATPAGSYLGRGQSVILDSNGARLPFETPAPGGLVLASTGAAFGAIGFVRRLRFGRCNVRNV